MDCSNTVPLCNIEEIVQALDKSCTLLHMLLFQNYLFCMQMSGIISLAAWPGLRPSNRALPGLFILFNFRAQPVVWLARSDL